MKKLLKEIIDYYLNSNDFNGLPLENIDSKTRKELCKLIDDGYIEILSETFVINPHIKAFSLNINKDEQKEEIYKDLNFIVAYPTEKALNKINIDDKKPFLQMLKKGIPKLNIIFFNLEILEEYFNDPRYICNFFGYRGSITVSDDFYEGDYDKYAYIDNFGIGYNKKSKKRVVGIFLDTLSKLSFFEQIRWNSHLLDNQEEYSINYPFYQNLVLGDWSEDISIFDALLDEIVIINKMCDNMKLPHLFREEFSNHTYHNIEDFRIMFFPTYKNYNNFILVLEKLFINNLNEKIFTYDSYPFIVISKIDTNGNTKGSLQMFSEWLAKNVKTQLNTDKEIFNVLKKIRKLRQVPAHKIVSNEYKPELIEEQDNLIVDLYKSIRAIRLLFTNYPGNNQIEIPEYLVTGEHIKLF